MNSSNSAPNNDFDEYSDLSDQIKALQLALAFERGKSQIQRKTEEIISA